MDFRKVTDFAIYDISFAIHSDDGKTINVESIHGFETSKRLECKWINDSYYPNHKYVGGLDYHAICLKFIIHRNIFKQTLNT